MSAEIGETNVAWVKKKHADNDDGAGRRLPLIEYSQWLRAADKSPGTVKLRRYQITRLGHDIDRPLHATTEDLICWLAGKAWSTETRRSYRASLRSFYGWALLAGYITADPSQGLPTVRPRPGVPRPAAESTIRAALAASDQRVRLMILLGAQAGLRRAEIAQVHTTDLQRDLDGWSLRVRGKGRRARLVPLTTDLDAALRRAPAGWVFPSPAGGHLTPAHVGKLVARALGGGVTTHQLRHRFATRAYAVDHDLLVVQQLLGHAKPETTMIYTRIPNAAKRRTIDQVAA